VDQAAGWGSLLERRGWASVGGFRFQEKQQPVASHESCGRLTPPHQPPQPSFFPYP
jgi:hypothetical protein